MALCLCELYLSGEYDKDPNRLEKGYILPVIILIHIIELNKVTKCFMVHIKEPLMLLLYV